MCNRKGIQIQIVLFLLLVAAVASTTRVHSIEKRSTRCILPPYPNNGFYEVAGDPAAKPGDELEYAYLNVSCYQGSGVLGNNVVLCVQGEWSNTMPQCVPVCYLQRHPSVTYTCSRLGAEGFGPCREYEPLGTSVKPVCRGGYYSEAPMPRMRCVGGSWTYVAQCTTECGERSNSSDTLPWYVYIYKTTGKETKYQPVCAGSIISSNLILTAAHCFWNDHLLTITTGSKYIAYPGENLLSEIENKEIYPVSDVQVAKRFQGESTNFQDDIAMVILSTALKFSTKVQPVCLDFDYNFKQKQMKEGNVGVLAVSFPMDEERSLLKVHRIPYIPLKKCIERAPPAFRDYIQVSSDKFCAGESGNIICKGNSGAGLAFPEYQRGVKRYFLRGLVSTVPSTAEEVCAPSEFIAFTAINDHENFIKEHLALALPISTVEDIAL